MTKQDFIKTLKELKKITDELERLRDLIGFWITIWVLEDFL